MNRNVSRWTALLASSLLILGLAGCELPGSAGNDKQQNGGDSQNQTAKHIHQGTITKDEVWKKADGPHIIRGEVSVDSAQGVTVTIEPGTVVRFEEGASLWFGYNERGVLKAQGTADQPIIFTSAAANPAKGDWNTIYLGNGSASTGMTPCKISYAGKSDYAALTVSGKVNTPTLQNCVIEESAGHGIALQNDASFKVFTGNTIKTSGENPIHLGANEVGSIGAGNTFTGNFHQALLVDGETVDKSATWLDLGIPYRLTGETTVESVGGPVLTIQPGSTLEFATDASLWVGHGAKGALNAVGTLQKPITFSSVGQDAGTWGGIHMYSGTIAGIDKNASTTVLEYVVISAAYNSSNNSMLHLYRANPILKNVSFTNRFGTSAAISVEGAEHEIPLKADLTGNGNSFMGKDFSSFGTAGIIYPDVD